MSRYFSSLKHNGPAIKGVSVAERMEAGAVSPNRGRVPAPAIKSEAWRGFCRQVASLLSFTSVAVQCFWREGHNSPYTGSDKEQWRGQGDVPL